MRTALIIIVLLALLSVAEAAQIPAPTITNPQNGQIISAFNINFAWTTVGGAQCYRLRQDGLNVEGGVTSQTSTIVSSWDATEGTHTYTVQSDDNPCTPILWDGGTSPAITLYIDRTPPFVSIVSPTTATVNTTANFTVTAYDIGTYPGAGIVDDSCIFYWNGKFQSFVTLDGNDSNVSMFANETGVFNATVECFDAANLGKNSTINVTVSMPLEKIPPLVSITSPSDGAVVNETVTINATASDNVGVTKVEFYADANLLGTDTSLPYSQSWNTMTVTNGNRTLTAKAYDAAGNVNSSSIYVIVSNIVSQQQPPEEQQGEEERLFVEIISPLPSESFIEEDNITVEAVVKNQSGAVAGATVSVSGACAGTLTDLENGSYSAACAAQAGKTQVTVSAAKRSAAALNSTPVQVKCRPKVAVSTAGLNVTITTTCGGATYTQPPTITVDGQTVSTISLGDGIYAVTLSKGTHTVSVSLAAYGRTFEQTQEVTVVAEVSSGKAEDVSALLTRNLPLIIALAALAVIILKTRRPKTGVEEKPEYPGAMMREEYAPPKKELGEEISDESSIEELFKQNKP